MLMFIASYIFLWRGVAQGLEKGSYEFTVSLYNDNKVIWVEKQMVNVNQDGSYEIEIGKLNELPPNYKEYTMEIKLGDKIVYKGKPDDNHILVWIEGTRNVVSQILSGSGINVVNGATETPTINLMSCSSGQILKSTGIGWQCDFDQVGSGASVCASVLTNYVQKWTGSNLCNTIIYDNGFAIGVSTTSLNAKLNVEGTYNGNNAWFNGGPIRIGGGSSSAPARLFFEPYGILRLPYITVSSYLPSSPQPGDIVLDRSFESPRENVRVYSGYSSSWKSVNSRFIGNTDVSTSSWTTTPVQLYSFTADEPGIYQVTVQMGQHACTSSGYSDFYLSPGTNVVRVRYNGSSTPATLILYYNKTTSFSETVNVYARAGSGSCGDNVNDPINIVVIRHSNQY